MKDMISSNGAGTSIDSTTKGNGRTPPVPLNGDLANLPNALDPLKALIDDFLRRGGVIWACPPCVQARGYTQDDFIDGVKIQGASAMHERLMAGASSLSF